MKLNIGCGPLWKFKRPDCDGLDKQDFGQKYVMDALDMGKKFKAGTVDEIYMDMFLEHLTYEDAVKMLNVCWKILREDGMVYVEVPSIERGKAYEFTHKSFYTLDTFREIEDQEMCQECGLKPFKVEKVFMNHKKNIYCYLKKAHKYVRAQRDYSTKAS